MPKIRAHNEPCSCVASSEVTCLIGGPSGLYYLFLRLRTCFGRQPWPHATGWCLLGLLPSASLTAFLLAAWVVLVMMHPLTEDLALVALGLLPSSSAVVLSRDAVPGCQGRGRATPAHKRRRCPAIPLCQVPLGVARPYFSSSMHSLPATSHASHTKGPAQSLSTTMGANGREHGKGLSASRPCKTFGVVHCHACTHMKSD